MKVLAPTSGWFPPVQREEPVQVWLAMVLILCHGALATFNFLKKKKVFFYNLKICWFLYLDPS